MRKSQSKAQSDGSIALSSLTKRVLNGQMNSFPNVVSLNLQQASEADYQALLQLIRHHSFGHRLLNTETGASPIQQIRTWISSGRFTEALRMAESLDTNNPDVRVEIARAKVFLGQFTNVPAILGPVISDLDVPASIRAVAAQLAGHALIELEQIPEAERSLKAAQTLADTSGNIVGSISVDFFLSRILAFRGEIEEALFCLERARDNILKLGSFRWLLGYYRHLSQALFFAGDDRCISEAYAGVLLARTLNDQLFEYRGILEIELMTRKFGLHFQLGELLQKMCLYSTTSESDLGLWIRYVYEGLAPQTHFAARMITESKFKNVEIRIRQLPNLNQAIFWIYDKRNQILIDLKSSKFSNMPTNSPQGKIISLLHSQQEAMEISDLFEQVWGLSWSPERHQNILDVTLHRLSKLSESLKIVRNDCTVRINCLGLIL